MLALLPGTYGIFTTRLRLYNRIWTSWPLNSPNTDTTSPVQQKSSARSTLRTGVMLDKSGRIAPWSEELLCSSNNLVCFRRAMAFCFQHDELSLKPGNWSITGWLASNATAREKRERKEKVKRKVTCLKNIVLNRAKVCLVSSCIISYITVNLWIRHK